MSKPRTADAFPAIDADALETVSGGRRAVTSSSRSSIDDRILDTLQDIESALKDVSRSNDNRSNDPFNNPMMLMTLLQGFLQPQATGGNGRCRRGRC